MITKELVAELLHSKETFRVERTTSTTDKEKFGETVCAFSNDMPDSGKSGYLLIGVCDDGSLNGLKATDELLKKFASNEPARDPINDPINSLKTTETQNDPINGPINGPIKQAIFKYVKQNPGCKRVDISTAVGLSVTSVKRIVNLMKAEIEYRGSNKKGGYYVREEDSLYK